MNTIQAIETHYQGYHFRSRLEARWAVFFSALGLSWEYEREGYELEDGTWYLPDFWLPDLEVWAEIKPNTGKHDQEAAQKCHLLSKKLQCPVLLIEGIPGSSDGLFCDYTISAYGGELWDMFIQEEKGYPQNDLFEYQWMGGARYFEELRQFVLIQIRAGEFISEKDIEPISVSFLDEVSRRKAIVELDRLYYRRKYGREHPRQKRSSHIRFKTSKLNKKGVLLETDVSPAYYEELDDLIKEAMRKARSARFEHGESG